MLFVRAQTQIPPRAARRPSARDLFWLGRAQAGRGLREAAGTSWNAAAERWTAAPPSAQEIAALSRARAAHPA